jgi:ABC-type Fe3+ transport system permease subunit
MTTQVKREDPSRLGVLFLVGVGIVTLIFTWKDVVIGWLSTTAEEERLVRPWSPSMTVPIIGALAALFCFAMAIVVAAISRRGNGSR